MVADRGVSWAEASSLAQQAANRKGSGFYRSKREQYHRHLYLLALQKESASHLFNIIRYVTVNILSSFLLRGTYRCARCGRCVLGRDVNSMYNDCVCRPNTGRSFYEETKTDLLNKYIHISPEEAGKTLFVSALRL